MTRQVYDIRIANLVSLCYCADRDNTDFGTFHRLCADGLLVVIAVLTPCKSGPGTAKIFENQPKGN